MATVCVLTCVLVHCCYRHFLHKTKAIAEDPDFDQEVDKLVSHIINLLEDKEDIAEEKPTVDPKPAKKSRGFCSSAPMSDDAEAAGGQLWSINDMFGCFFVDPLKDANSSRTNQDVLIKLQAFEETHDSAEILIR